MGASFKSALGIVMVVVLLPAPRARAQGETETRQTKAKVACAAGRVEEGVEILAGLYAETGDVNYVYNQGRCYQQNGRVEPALNRFREYLRRATGATTQERAEVQGFIDELERQQASAAAQRDSGADEARRAKTLRTVSLTLAGVGVAAVATGVVLSLKVRSAQRDTERYVKETQPFAEPTVVAAKMRSGGRLETFQWVAYGVGVAALAGSVTTFLLSQRSDGEQRVAFAVAPGPHGLTTSLRLRF